MPEDEAALRAEQRAFVRRGHDVISQAYRGGEGAAHLPRTRTPAATWSGPPNSPG
jgi:hypothetical protein